MQIEFILELNKEEVTNKLLLTVGVNTVTMPELEDDPEFDQNSISELWGHDIFKPNDRDRGYETSFIFQNNTGIDNLEIKKINYLTQEYEKHIYYYTINAEMYHPVFGTLNFFFCDYENDSGDGIGWYIFSHLKNVTQNFEQVLSFIQTHY